MKKYLIITIIILFLPNYGQTFDIRNMVSNLTKAVGNNEIIPDKSIFGVPYGTSEDEFIEKFGKPIGYIQISQSKTGMIYGKKYLFLFTDTQLSGIRISHNIIDWQISNQIVGNSPFDNYQWKLDNNLKKEMSLTDVKKILGSRLETGRHGYKKLYKTTESTVTLNFSHYPDAGDSDDSYKLHGILIQKN